MALPLRQLKQEFAHPQKDPIWLSFSNGQKMVVKARKLTYLDFEQLFGLGLSNTDSKASRCCSQNSNREYKASLNIEGVLSTRWHNPIFFSTGKADKSERLNQTLPVRSLRRETFSRG
jgi:hypothetical protein